MVRIGINFTTFNVWIATATIDAPINCAASLKKLKHERAENRLLRPPGRGVAICSKITNAQHGVLPGGN